MQNKNNHFAVLFAIVCLYQLSFTWKVNQIEDDAANYALNVKNNPKILKRQRSRQVSFHLNSKELLLSSLN